MYCPACGHQLEDGRSHCAACGAAVPGRSAPAADGTPEGIGLLIPYKPEPLSLVAGYLGLASFLVCGAPGPVAVLLGVLGLRRLKRNPELTGKARAWTGIVLGTISTAVFVAFIVLILTQPGSP